MLKQVQHDSGGADAESSSGWRFAVWGRAVIPNLIRNLWEMALGLIQMLSQAQHDGFHFQGDGLPLWGHAVIPGLTRNLW